LGLTVALPRFIARNSHSRSDAPASSGYFGAAVFSVLLTTGLFFVLTNALPARIAGLFFGSPALESLIFPLSLLVMGLAFHTVTYAYFRGHMEMKRANALQFINLAVIPPLVLLSAKGDVRVVLIQLGILTLMVACGAICLFAPWREVFASSRSKVNQLARYGLQRVPGDLALLGLFALPTTITAHARGVREAGLVAFATLALSIVSAAVNPLGLILLPKASRMFAGGDFSSLRQHVLHLVSLTVVVTGAVAAALGIFASPLVKAYLGPEFLAAADLIRLASVGIVPYCLFLLLSHVLDAFHENSVTARIEVVAVSFASIGCWIAWVNGRTSAGFVVAFVVGLFTLGLLAIAACVTIFRAVHTTQSAQLSTGLLDAFSDGGPQK
jgi:O-antigen/teichoic acid export membrane protein